jgi:hypothetical protein
MSKTEHNTDNDNFLIRNNNNKLKILIRILKILWIIFIILIIILIIYYSEKLMFNLFSLILRFDILSYIVK